MLRGKHMGFKSVRRVEVKAETTTPGELRAATDASGARVGTSRSRRTLPKLEFTVDEDGAVLHGPQRGSYPFYATASSDPNVVSAAADAPFSTALERDLAASFQALHMRDFPSPPAEQQESDRAEQQQNDADDAATPPPQMKECVLNDTRATTLALKYDNAVGKFVCGSSIERFSGHTGVCRVLGSKKYPIIPHSLRLGDLLRIGSVGLVVCELNRTTSEETEEALTNEQYEFLKENYLSLPLQQTFHPTERSPDMEDGEHDDDKDHEHTMRVGGDTSDEGESEEDKDRKAARRSSGDSGDSADARHNNLPLGVAGTTGKRFCYICYDGDECPDTNPLVAPCHCKGDTKYVHLDCLQRWNNNLDADGTNPNQKVCAVTNTDGLDVCSICKATYLTSVRLEDGRVVSLLAKKLPPPYVTFAVVTQHETRNRSTALTNTRFQLSFANMPRNQQFLTIGRSTTNNMTLRYRTVSQLHAKVKYQDNHFFLFDASSSNGTMLFLSKPLELEWGRVMHVKIGRTILSLKAKKKWKWAGSSSGDDEDDDEGGRVSSPRMNGRDLENRLSSPGLVGRGNDFDMSGSSTINDPSAELVAAPYSNHLPRTYTAPNVLGSRWNRSAPSNALNFRPPRQRSLSSSAPMMLHGDSSIDALDIPSAFHVDELEPDEPDTFETQAVREPVVLPAPSTSFRDFAAENASPSLTSQLAGEGIVGVNAHSPARTQLDLPVQRRGLYDLVDSLSERGSSPVVATLSPAGRLTEQD
ncbi:fha domain protein [Phytophthora cinnamomi]|uniref:fha domain protein n=1 Tax=Phytophthora cinnamomi TaxID=4785 RepID=UPI003559A06C|nr:fha domain protein [Phytophthora cinnamomi]